MDLTKAIRARHMVRTFTDQPISDALLLDILEQARRAPSAGNTQPVEFLVLAKPEEVSLYWRTSMTTEGRGTFRWQSLLVAPALVLVLTRPDAYVARYAEPDKHTSNTAESGLGSSTSAWPVPYWWVDAGAVIQNLLLLAVDEGLGACLFGPFDHEKALRTVFDIPSDRRMAATIALGHPAKDQSGRSAHRTRPALDEITHWGSWGLSG